MIDAIGALAEKTLTLSGGRGRWAFRSASGCRRSSSRARSSPLATRTRRNAATQRGNLASESLRFCPARLQNALARRRRDETSRRLAENRRRLTFDHTATRGAERRRLKRDVGTKHDARDIDGQRGGKFEANEQLVGVRDEGRIFNAAAEALLRIVDFRIGGGGAREKLKRREWRRRPAANSRAHLEPIERVRSAGVAAAVRRVAAVGCGGGVQLADVEPHDAADRRAHQPVALAALAYSRRHKLRCSYDKLRAVDAHDAAAAFRRPRGYINQ